MATIDFQERSVDRVIDQYLESRRNTDRPISVAGAVRAVRMISACPQLSDEQLGSVIIEAAVAKGRNLAFDLNDPQVAFPLHR